MKQTKNVRDIALDVLKSVEKNQSYSNLLLNSMINKHQFSWKRYWFANRNHIWNDSKKNDA